MKYPDPHHNHKIQARSLLPNKLEAQALELQAAGILPGAYQAGVPETSSTVNDVVFTNTPNGTLNDVVATIPASKAAGGKLFGRLKAEE